MEIGACLGFLLRQKKQDKYEAADGDEMKESDCLFKFQFFLS